MSGSTAHQLASSCRARGAAAKGDLLAGPTCWRQARARVRARPKETKEQQKSKTQSNTNRQTRQTPRRVTNSTVLRYDLAKNQTSTGARCCAASTKHPQPTHPSATGSIEQHLKGLPDSWHNAGCTTVTTPAASQSPEFRVRPLTWNASPSCATSLFLHATSCACSSFQCPRPSLPSSTDAASQSRPEARLRAPVGSWTHTQRQSV